jgi:hypothetical protein
MRSHANAMGSGSESRSRKEDTRRIHGGQSPPPPLAPHELAACGLTHAHQGARHEQQVEGRRGCRGVHGEEGAERADLGGGGEPGDLEHFKLLCV